VYKNNKFVARRTEVNCLIISEFLTCSRMLKYNIKMDVKETGLDIVDWIYLAQDRDHCGGVLWNGNEVSQHPGNFYHMKI
jgi:hypothetical protein